MKLFIGNQISAGRCNFGFLYHRIIAKAKKIKTIEIVNVFFFCIIFIYHFGIHILCNIHGDTVSNPCHESTRPFDVLLSFLTVHVFEMSVLVVRGYLNAGSESFQGHHARKLYDFQCELNFA